MNVVSQKATLDEDEDDDSEDDDDNDDGCDAEDSNDDDDDEDDDDEESDEESGKKITPPVCTVNLTSCRAFQFSTQYVAHSNHGSQIRLLAIVRDWKFPSLRGIHRSDNIQNGGRPGGRRTG